MEYIKYYKRVEKCKIFKKGEREGKEKSSLKGTYDEIWIILESVSPVSNETCAF